MKFSEIQVCFLIGWFASLPFNLLHAQNPVPRTDKTKTIDGKTYYLHTVEKGQSLDKIARTYNVKVNDLLVENPDAIDTIIPGQELKIRLMNAAPPAALTDKPSPLADSVKASVPPALTFSGYADVYCAYYTDSVGTGNYQKFPTLSPCTNQFGLNIALLSAKYSTEKLRGVITLHYGDIPRSTWSPSYNFIEEANIGVRLSKKTWLDGGFFRTHIGTEGLFPKENIASSIGIGTYHEPYYQAGIKWGYAPTEKLALSLHLLNGYNVFDDNNEKKGMGLLVNYTFNKNFSLGYSNYVGDESPMGDSADHTRFYNNLFINWQIKKIKIQIGGDYAMQKNSDITNNKLSACMYSGVTSVKYQVRSRFAIYSRGEVFSDPNGFLSGVFLNTDSVLTGLELSGVTAGFEYKPNENSYFRLEGRQLQADFKQKIFRWENRNTNARIEVMLHFGVSF